MAAARQFNLKHRSHCSAFSFSLFFLISNLFSLYIVGPKVSPTMVTSLLFMQLLALLELAYGRPRSVNSVVRKSNFAHANATPAIEKAITAIGGAQALDSMNGLQYEAST